MQTLLHPLLIRIANGFDLIPESQRLGLFALDHDLSRGIPKDDPFARLVAAHDALHPNRGACGLIRQYLIAQSNRKIEARVGFYRADNFDVRRAAHPKGQGAQICVAIEPGGVNAFHANEITLLEMKRRPVCSLQHNRPCRDAAGKKIHYAVRWIILYMVNQAFHRYQMAIPFMGVLARVGHRFGFELHILLEDANPGFVPRQLLLPGYDYTINGDPLVGFQGRG